jgi:acyl-CoA synthetase (AMP-forming)/AMP-acid ligase II
MSTPATFTTTSVTDWIDHHAKRSPDAIAIITPNTTLTYGALAQRIEHGAQKLSACGVAAGDLIALIVSDELLLLSLLLAAARLAAPVLLIQRSATPGQRSNWMTAAGVKHWISDVMPAGSKHGPLNAIDAIALMATTAGAFRWHPPANGLDPHNSIFLIVAGSGSTGKQKLIPITHAQMQSRARHLCSRLGVTSHDRLATLSHLEYVGGVHRLMAAICVGAGFVLFDRKRNDWRHWHQRYGLTILSATVFHVHLMLKELHESDTPQLRPLDPIQLSLSSSVVTQELRQTIMTELCSNLRVSYGTNESWSVSEALPSDLLRYPGTVGHILPNIKLNIVDEQLHPLPIGQKGLIAIQSDQLITGYLDNEQANQKAFRGGWFIPGDLGYLTDDGQLIFCGRADNMMIFNGINIYPIEIEQCLLAHPEVADVLAMPTRHAVHQDVPIALVTLKTNAQSTEQQLLNYAAAVLGPKQPRRIFLTSAIPRNHLGKPIREEVINILKQELS